MHVLIAPDAFMGSLDAAEVAEAVARGIRSASNASLTVLPLADGGDGTVAAAIHAGFAPLAVSVAGATGLRHEALIAFDGETVVVELANTCGLGMLTEVDALGASTYGLGEAIAYAVTLAPRRIVVALGGSASTDGGTGMLAALGVTISDATGAALPPGGGALSRLAAIGELPDLGGIDIVCATDVINPLTGPNGAAAVFGPQKGATTHDVSTLDAGLAWFAALTDVDPGTPGAGAAGGTGFGCLLLGARIVSGADYVLDLLDFDGQVARADLVVTGEGSLDEQTEAGKLVSAVTARAGSTPVVAVVGRSLLDSAAASALGIDRVYALGDFTTEPTASDPVLTARTLALIGAAVAVDYLS